MSAFPAGFLWGAATAAHQIEGGNVNSDCWALEHTAPSLFAEPSGDAVDAYHRYAEDLDLAAGLGLNAYRFSVEWARIEPEPGCFSQAALDHYARVVGACAERDLAAVVTFHHFTQPRWMAARGGLESVEFADRFAAYCRRVAHALDGMAFACTLNELNLPVMAGRYFHSQASPDKKAAGERALGAPLSSFFLFSSDDAILNHGLAAHAQARQAIRAERSALGVGMTLAISEEGAEPGAEAMRDARCQRIYQPFLDAAANDEFIGVQTYARTVTRADGGSGPAAGAALTTMGWEDRPEAIGQSCRWVAAHSRTPILITENGYPGDDPRRAEFIAAALEGVAGAIAEGVDVRGYFYWSLLDNFEWMFGYRQRFGLVEVDRATQRRVVKPSANVLAAAASGRAPF